MIYNPIRSSFPLRNESGGVGIRATIVLITLCVIGVIIYQLLHTLGQNQQIEHRKALAISEYGLMITLQQVPAGSSLPPNIGKTEYDHGWYQVTTEKKVQNDTLFCTITSKGHFGSVTEQRECVLRLEVNGHDSSWVRESIR